MDLEHFPTAESAVRMMSYITQNGWYDKSYVAKWLFQVMGLEIDHARDVVESLRYQAFPETASWCLEYHEMKYGLPVHALLSDDERRRRIIEHRDTLKPVSPWRMECLIYNALKTKVRIQDINEGAPVAHPNTFEVQINEQRNVDFGAVIKKIRQIKQSHTTFDFYITCEIGLVIRQSSVEKQASVDMCGTLPDINTGGAVGRPGIEVRVKPASNHSSSIFPGGDDAGEYPMVSKDGKINNVVLSTNIAPAAHMSELPYAAEVVTGSAPDYNIVLNTDQGHIQIVPLADSFTGFSIYSGEDKSGNEPEKNLSLDKQPGALDMGINTNVFLTDVRMCGEEW